MKPLWMTAILGFGAGVMLLGAGAILVQGADYSGTEGELTTRSDSAGDPVSAFDLLAGRPAAFFPDFDYHLALGLVGSGMRLELTKANKEIEFLAQPSRAAGQHFRPAMQQVHYFGLRRVPPEFAFSGNHFHLAAKPLPSVEVARQAKPSTLQFPDVPTLNQKAPGPNHIIDDPKNAAEHRLP